MTRLKSRKHRRIAFDVDPVRRLSPLLPAMTHVVIARIDAAGPDIPVGAEIPLSVENAGKLGDCAKMGLAWAALDAEQGPQMLLQLPSPWNGASDASQQTPDKAVRAHATSALPAHGNRASGPPTKFRCGLQNGS